jgi:hypothetical protein
MVGAGAVELVGEEEENYGDQFRDLLHGGVVERGPAGVRSAFVNLRSRLPKPIF